MGSLFRSADMTLCQLFLQSEAAYACVSELGELGLVQFRDLNLDVNDFQRKFVNEVRRCAEMERKLQYVEKEIKIDGIPILDTGENPEAPQPREMINLEATFKKLEKELLDVTDNAEALRRNFLELAALKQVLHKTEVFFNVYEAGNSTESIHRHSCISQIELSYVAGVILRERIPAFERMLWRACRGNFLLRQAEMEVPLEDHLTGDRVFKSVFIIFFQGALLKTKVKKICEGFRATLYPCPEVPVERRELAMDVMTRIEDISTVLEQTQDHRRRVLVAAAKNIKNWLIKVRKIKAIYHTLNSFSLDVTQKCLIAECWIPVMDLENIQMALKRGTERSGHSVPPILHNMETCEYAPTYNYTNKYTSGFQKLVDAYGIASYREMNPAPYTIITFPFLFAVMFGDCGHGLLITLFGVWMILKEKSLATKKIENEIWVIFFGGRYIILLMGLFSMYAGLIYNDVFSRSLNIFGSYWSINNKTKEHATLTMKRFYDLNPATDDYDGVPYPLGLDPIWQLAENKIIFLNSYKMKLSIILGVLHMLFGVIISLLKNLHFKQSINIFCEFIPQFIFLSFLFLYMVILMFMKWIMFFPTNDPELMQSSPTCAPSILITFINMVLFKHSDVIPGCADSMYPGQIAIQKILVLCAAICVPWMLLAKPIIITRRQMNRTYSFHQQVPTDDEQSIQHNTAQAKDGHGSGHDKHEDIGELFIHQAIHTIEYVLGSVSHTASYLRLWALSLAHTQLSEVLWKMVLSKGFLLTGWRGGIALYIIFSLWACLTVSILVLIEGLSAFLHTLRLHWVEFQSKFYSGLGRGFQPFSFKLLLDSPSQAREKDVF